MPSDSFATLEISCLADSPKELSITVNFPFAISSGAVDP
jgi:hypothetical protein